LVFPSNLLLDFPLLGDEAKLSSIPPLKGGKR
jgi:hypothetical protein